MLLTVVYTVGKREFTHTAGGESLTRFLRRLDREGVKWKYADRKPVGSNLFAGIVVRK